MIIKKRNTPGREPFIGHTEFYTKRLLDEVAFSTPSAEAVTLQTPCGQTQKNSGIVLDCLVLHGASQPRPKGLLVFQYGGGQETKEISKGCILP